MKSSQYDSSNINKLCSLCFLGCVVACSALLGCGPEGTLTLGPEAQVEGHGCEQLSSRGEFDTHIEIDGETVVLLDNFGLQAGEPVNVKVETSSVDVAVGDTVCATSKNSEENDELDDDELAEDEVCFDMADSKEEYVFDLLMVAGACQLSVTIPAVFEPPE